MRFPKMNKQALITARVPALNGGTNLHEAANMVEDHQLTNSHNIWWHDAALRTRPGLVARQNGQLPKDANGHTARFYTSNFISEREAILGQVLPAADGLTGTFRMYSLDIDDGLVIRGKREGIPLNQDGTVTGFGVKASKGSQGAYYYYLSTGEILTQNQTEERTEHTFTSDGDNSSYTLPVTAEAITVHSVTLNVGHRTIQLNDVDDGGEWTEITPEEAGENLQAFYPTADAFSVGYGHTGDNTVRFFYLSPGGTKRNDWYIAPGADDNLKITATATELLLEDARPYIPTVMVNGRGAPDGSTENAGTRGTFYEGYNLLTNQFKCTYTTDGAGKVFYLPITTVTNQLEVSLSLRMGDNTIKTFKATLTKDNTGRVKFDQDITDENDLLAVTTQSDVDGYIDLIGTFSRLELYARYYVADDCASLTIEGQIYGSAHDYPINVQLMNMAGIQHNNLELVATLASNQTDRANTISKMTRCVWFGGDRSGIGGGTRLFVCGNPDKPNLVHWSDVNKPLYFPENNYAYIGGGDEAVTGFGKQGELLVIFKEHELYCAQYVAGTDFTYEDVISGEVTDVTAYLAQFPIAPLHSTIGCDCPDSIRLVNNKLVWACSNGRVYLLPTANQYNERNVREASPNIQARLQQEDKALLKTAVAGEFCGYYTLLVGERTYLMDADTSAFASFQYYASQEKAQRNLPWYVWTLSARGDEWVTMVSDGDRVRLLKQSTWMPEGLVADSLWTVYGLDGVGDEENTGSEERPISCSFSTKLFDFDRMDVKKAIPQVYLGLTAASGCRVRVSYVTDEYTAQDAYILYGEGDPQERDALAFRQCRLTPNVHRAALFGLTVACEGSMAATGMTIKYKTQGVTR